MFDVGSELTVNVLLWETSTGWSCDEETNLLLPAFAYRTHEMKETDRDSLPGKTEASQNAVIKMHCFICV